MLKTKTLLLFSIIINLIHLKKKNHEFNEIFELVYFKIKGKYIGQKTAFDFKIKMKKLELFDYYFGKNKISIKIEMDDNYYRTSSSDWNKKYNGYFKFSDDGPNFECEVNCHDGKNFNFELQKSKLNNQHVKDFKEFIDIENEKEINIQFYIANFVNPRKDYVRVENISISKLDDGTNSLYYAKNSSPDRLKISLEKSNYSFNVKKFCDFLPIGFKIKAFEIEPSKFFQEEVSIELQTFYQNSVKIYPSKITFRFGFNKPVIVYISVNSGFKDKYFSMKAKLLKGNHQDFITINQIFKVKNYFKDPEYDFSKLEINDKNANCFPRAEIIPNQISAVFNTISLPIKVGFSFPLANDMEFDNPFLFLQKNIEINCLPPSKLKFKKNEKKKLVHLTFKNDFKFIELKINLNLEMELMIDLNKLRDLIEENINLDPIVREMTALDNGNKNINEHIKKISNYLSKNMGYKSKKDLNLFSNNILLHSVSKKMDLESELFLDSKLYELNFTDEEKSNVTDLTKWDKWKKKNNDEEFYYFYKNFQKVRITNKLKIQSNQPLEVCFFVIDEFFFKEYKDVFKLKKIGQACFDYNYDTDTYYYEEVEKYNWIFYRETTDSNEFDYNLIIDLRKRKKINKNGIGFLFIQDMYQEIKIVNFYFDVKLVTFIEQSRYLIKIKNHYFDDMLEYIINSKWKKKELVHYLDFPEEIKEFYDFKSFDMKKNILGFDGMIDKSKKSKKFIYFYESEHFLDFVELFTTSDRNYQEPSMHHVMDARFQEFQFKKKLVTENKIDFEFVFKKNHFVIKNYLFTWSLKGYILNNENICDFQFLIHHKKESKFLDISIFERSEYSQFPHFKEIKFYSLDMFDYFSDPDFFIPLTIENLKLNNYYIVRNQFCLFDHIYHINECYYNINAELEFFTHQKIYLKNQKKDKTIKKKKNVEIYLLKTLLLLILIL